MKLFLLLSPSWVPQNQEEDETCFVGSQIFVFHQEVTDFVQKLNVFPHGFFLPYYSFKNGPFWINFKIFLE